MNIRVYITGATREIRSSWICDCFAIYVLKPGTPSGIPYLGAVMEFSKIGNSSYQIVKMRSYQTMKFMQNFRCPVFIHFRLAFILLNRILKQSSIIYTYQCGSCLPFSRFMNHFREYVSSVCVCVCVHTRFLYNNTTPFMLREGRKVELRCLCEGVHIKTHTHKGPIITHGGRQVTIFKCVYIHYIHIINCIY